MANSPRTVARRRPRVTPVPLPHSWMFSTWPSGVAPGDESGARYLFRTFRRDLIAAGAVTRVGRQVIFLGRGYEKFLQSRIAEVDGFEIAMNRVRAARRAARS